MRGRFHPRDKHLYVSGLRGWVTNATADGCFQRVRYTGQPMGVPVQMRTYANGIALTFSEPLQRQRAEDPDSYRVEQWNYRWSAEYGSPEFKPSQPSIEGREAVYVESASLLPDERTVFLEIASLTPVWQLGIQSRVATASGEIQSRSTYCTLHHVPSEKMDVSRLTRRRSRGYLTEQERQQLQSGLIVRYRQSTAGKELLDVAHRRMAALYVKAGQSPASRLTVARFHAVFEGYVRATDPGQYRVRLAGIGKARLYLNDQLVDEMSGGERHGEQAADVAHDFLGYVRLRIEYEQDQPGKDAALQFLWTPENGPEEPVPPTALWCSTVPVERFLISREGVHLRNRFRCENCHTPKDGWRIGEPSKVTDAQPGSNDGPSLVKIGARVQREWLVRWLLNPHELRNESTMPRLLGKSDGVSAQQAADLAAFLLQGTGDVHALDRPPAAKPPASIEEGERLWEELGCIGCHRLSPPDSKDAFDRLSLHFVALKCSHHSLLDFLRQPQAHYRLSRMPDFYLSDHEAAALAEYLINNTPQTWDDNRMFPPGDAVAGRALAAQFHCAHCHEMGTEALRKELLQPSKPLPVAGPFDIGCLGTKQDWNPEFVFSDRQVTAIASTLSSVRPQQLDAGEEAQRLFVTLRCNVCHARDGASSQLPAVVAEEGALGRLAESFPDLTWAGERLKASWLEDFVAGKRRDRVRPQLKARMPAFPAYASAIAHGFAAQHAVPSGSEPGIESQPAPVDRAIGYTLTLKDGGLDCRQCHGIGHHEPVADDRTRIAPGINFVLVRDRLRYDFYRRFVLDPPRYDLNTKMPKLSADGKTTTVTHIFHGDAPRQFDAIWTYIQTLHGDEP